MSSRLEIVEHGIQSVEVLVADACTGICHQGVVDLLFGLQVHHRLVLSVVHSRQLAFLRLLVIDTYLLQHFHRHVLQGDADVVGEEFFSVEQDFRDVFPLIGHFTLGDAQSRHLAHQFQQHCPFRHTEGIGVEDGRVAQDTHLLQLGDDDRLFHRDGFLVECDGVQPDDVDPCQAVFVGVGPQVGDVHFVVFGALLKGVQDEVSVLVRHRHATVVGRVGQTIDTYAGIGKGHDLFGFTFFHLHMSGHLGVFPVPVAIAIRENPLRLHVQADTHQHQAQSLQQRACP